MKRKCISCGRDISVIDNSVIFKCPECGKSEIVRCGHCKKLAVNYVCPKCGFEGP